MPNNEIPNPTETNANPFPENLEEELKKETALFLKEISIRGDSATGALRSLPTDARAQWMSAINKNSELMETTIIKKDILGFADDNCGRPVSDVYTAARCLLLDQTIEDRRKIAKQHKVLELYDPMAQYERFHESGVALCKIGQLSISDIASNKKLPAIAVLSSFTESIAQVNPISETNPIYQDPLVNLYPNTAKITYTDAKLAMLSVFALSSMNPQILERTDLIQGNPKITAEIIKKAKQIAGQARVHLNNITDTLLEPNSSDFISLKELMEKWLLKTDKSVLVAPFLTSSGLIKDSVYDYRKAKKLAQANINSSGDFYNLLSESLLEYMQPSLTEEGFLTTDDIPTILDTDQITAGDTPSIGDIKNRSNDIFQKSSNSTYNLDPENISWRNLLPPETVYVHFPQGNGRKILLTLFYKNDKGESLILQVDFDTKKNIMDWIFMDAPDDPSMQPMKNALMQASYDILTNAAQLAEAEYQQRQRGKQVITQPNQPRPKPEYVPREKQEKQDGQRLPKTLTPIEQILQSSIFGGPLPETPVVKNNIILPEKQELTDLMSQIDIPDRDMIITDIQDYNERAKGEFKMLKGEGKDGNKLYSLRVNRGPKGGSRVLLQETKSEDTPQNRRTFEIIDIGYRKNIYRNL